MKKLQVVLSLGAILLLSGVALVVALTRSSASADSGIKVWMYNGNLTEISNTIYPRLKVENIGEAAVPLENLKIRYYYTLEGDQAQNFWCDWSTVGVSHVTGEFVSLNAPATSADRYAEIGFTHEAGNLAPGASIEVHVRLTKADWSSYNQLNDYSFNVAAANYVAWNKIAGYNLSTLSWGTVPDQSSATVVPVISTPVMVATKPAMSITEALTPTATPVVNTTGTATPVVNTTGQAAPIVNTTKTATPVVNTTKTVPAHSSNTDRYFPLGTSVNAIKAGASALTKQQVKELIVRQVDEHWSLLQSKLGFTSKDKAYAFFQGMATRESTLNAGLETGGKASHSYGPLQAAETAYANADPNYMPETDVPEMIQYDFTPENFYDPSIAVHMGIRHLLHFANQAKAAGYSGIELLKYALIGYNTGWVKISDQNWLREYSDETGALAGWYLSNGHLHDNVFTWTGSPDVKRSNSWGWY